VGKCVNMWRRGPRKSDIGYSGLALVTRRCVCLKSALSEETISHYRHDRRGLTIDHGLKTYRVHLSETYDAVSQ